MSKVRMNLTKQEFSEELKLSSKTLLQMAEVWRKRIYSFTKSGKSLVTGDKFKSLKQGYVDFRRKYQGARGELFKPAKSNLTLTGQMLESLRERANQRQQRININLVGNRDDGKSKDEVAKYVAENGRPFLGLDDKGRERLNQIALRDIRRRWKERNRAKKR
jgi:hypothetical protein